MSHGLYCAAPDPTLGPKGICGCDYPCGLVEHEPFGFVDLEPYDDVVPEPPEPEEW